MRPLALWVGLLVLSQAVGAQTLAVAPAPGWVTPSSWKPGPAGKAGGDYEDLVFDREINLATQEYHVHEAYRFLSSKGVREGGTVQFDFQPYETLTLHTLRLWRDGRVIDQSTLPFQLLHRESGLEESLYDGTQSWVAPLRNVQVGDVLEFSYTLRGRNPVFGDRFADAWVVEGEYALDHWGLRVVAPQGKLPVATTLGGLGAGTRASLGALEEVRWDLHQVPAFTWNRQTPTDAAPVRRLALSQWTNWTQVRVWAQDLFRKAPNPEVTQKAQALAAHLGPEEAGRVLLTFVQDQIRYFGIEVGPGSHRPRDPQEVLDSGFGDCKDKAVLFCSLAQAVGLEAWPVLVNTRRGDWVADEGPSPGAFNHVVVRVKINGEVYLVDPTANRQGGPLSQRSHQALPWGLEVRDGIQALTALGPASDGTRDLDEEFRFESFTSKGVVTKTYTFRGWDADNQRAQWESVEPQKSHDDLVEYLSDRYGPVTITREPQIVDDREANVVRLSYEFELKDYWSLDKDQYSTSIYPTLVGEDLADPPSTFTRTQTLGIEFPVTVHEKRRIVVPTRWNDVTSDHTLETPWFTVRAQARNLDPQTLEFEDTFVSRASRVEPADLPAYLAKLKEGRNAVSWTITHQKDAPPPPAPAPAASPEVAAWATGLSAVLVFFLGVWTQGSGF